MHDIAITTKLNLFFSNFVIALINVTSFRNTFKILVNILRKSLQVNQYYCTISWIYGFQMKQSFANSPFVVDSSISHWSVIYITLLTTKTFHPQAKRLHYDNKVNLSSSSSTWPCTVGAFSPWFRDFNRKINRHKQDKRRFAMYFCLFTLCLPSQFFEQCCCVVVVCWLDWIYTIKTISMFAVCCFVSTIGRFNF